MHELKKPTDKINIIRKDTSDEDLAYHTYYSLEKLTEFIYFNRNKWITLSEGKEIVNLESGYKIFNGDYTSGIGYDRKYLKNISNKDINYFQSRKESMDSTLIAHNELSMVRNSKSRGYREMVSYSYTFHFEKYSYFPYSKREYLEWINLWSKTLRKRMIKYLYKLQKNDYSDEALNLFFKRLNRNFDFMLNCVLSDRIEGSIGLVTKIQKVLDIVPMLETAEYRETAINNLVS